MLTVFKIFFNKVKYRDYKYTRLCSNCGLEYNNYKIKAFRLSKGIT